MEPIRLLYVDDDRCDRELVKDALREEPARFTLVEATSRTEFETRLAEGPYDAVLTDFHIAGFNGFQVLDLVRSVSPGLPVIVVTGTGSEEIAAETMKRGAIDYVIKSPHHLRRLPATILKALAQRRIEEESRRAAADVLRMNSVLRAIREVEQLISRERERGRLLQGFCKSLTSTRGYEAAWIVLLDESGRAGEIAQQGCAETFASLAERMRSGLLPPCVRRVVEQDSPFLVEHYDSFCADCPLSSLCGARWIRPLRRAPGEKALGVLAVAIPVEIALDPKEEELLDEVALQLLMALQVIDREAAASRAAEDQKVAFRVLTLLNTGLAQIDTVQEILRTIREHANCRSGAIRLREGEQFPFYAVQGLPPELVELEGDICSRDDAGERIRDVQSRPRFDCICGAVLNERTDASLPFFTEGGSFWTGRASDVFACEKGSRSILAQRGRCVAQGFESLAVIPLRDEKEIIGLVHIADPGKDAFGIEAVRFLEKLGASVAIALARQKAEVELRGANAQLASALGELKTIQAQILQQERLRALGTMASGIAHDFNNALTPILGYSDLLANKPELLVDSETALKYLKTIYRAAVDASAVVKRLREFYRHRDPDEALEVVHLDTIAEETVAFTAPKWKGEAQAKGREIRIRTHLEKVPPIAGNRASLREMLTNLVFNAVDALPSGGTITIETKCGEAVRPDGNLGRLGGADGASTAVLSISDTGAGMTKEVKQRCFDPFFTTKGEQGSGLGLSMVYGIVKRHEGEIDVRSEPGEGTTFTLRFPVGLPRAEPRDLPAAPQPTRALRVLLVEDGPDVRAVMKAFLEHEGHSVETAGNGREGAEKFRGGRFDLVVTDLAMPVMNGVDMASLIKQLAPRVPIVLLTGFGEVLAEAGQSPSHVDALISKPVTLSELRAALAKATARTGTLGPGPAAG